MHWLPSPADFRQSLKSALEADQAEERLENLAAVAQLRLGFVETIQVDNALKAIAKDTASGAAAGFPRVRLAVLASSTIDHLLPAIRVAGLRRRLLVEVYASSFGQYRQELKDPASALYGFKPEVILFSLVSRETVAGVLLTASAEEAQGAVAATIDELRGLWREARENLGATVIQQTFLDVTETLFGSYDQMVPGAPARVVADLNAQLAVAVAQEGVLLLDVARSSTRDGIDAWFDVARWLQGKIEIAPQAAPIYGDLVARLIAARRGQSKKCLVLDLDDTLWGGVIGDVGLEGIVLGEGSAAGEAHLALQRYARSLKARGIILAVCSKNEAAIAEAAFREHPEMLLKRADITAFLVNWTDKAENLRAIAEQLNIGLDSLVFVDDNPAERARVRASLPMVAVPELPDDPAHYAGMTKMLSAPEADGRYIHVGIFMLLFERMHSLRGFARTLEDLYLEPSLSAELADQLVEFDLRVIRNAASAVGAARIHALTFTDDWGTQTSCFVSPDFWREFFQPRYRRIFDECHALGWDVNIHSCGKVNDLIEPLIEIGLDVIEIQQPRALGIEEIGRRYRGRICFASLCDIQATLPFKSDAEIRDEARLLLERWATPAGGFILADYGDGEAIGVPIEKKRVMLEAFLEFDPWAAQSGRRVLAPTETL